MRIELEFEVGDGFPVYVDQEIGSFGIAFSKEDMPTEGNMPSEDALKQLINEIKGVMKDLQIEHPSYFILKLKDWTQHFSNNASSNGMFLLRLPVQISEDKITVHHRRPHRHELYHELMHIKDVVSNRFPTIGCGMKIMVIINLLWDFSIEGRLERMGLGSPLKREEAVGLHKAPNLSGKISRKKAEKLCDRFWGNEVRYEELKSIAQKLT